MWLRNSDEVSILWMWALIHDDKVHTSMCTCSGIIPQALLPQTDVNLLVSTNIQAQRMWTINQYIDDTVRSGDLRISDESCWCRTLMPSVPGNSMSLDPHGTWITRFVWEHSSFAVRYDIMSMLYARIQNTHLQVCALTFALACRAACAFFYSIWSPVARVKSLIQIHRIMSPSKTRAKPFSSNQSFTGVPNKLDLSIPTRELNKYILIKDPYRCTALCCLCQPSSPATHMVAQSFTDSRSRYIKCDRPLDIQNLFEFCWILYTSGNMKTSTALWLLAILLRILG